MNNIAAARITSAAYSGSAAQAKPASGNGSFLSALSDTAKPQVQMTADDFENMYFRASGFGAMDFLEHHPSEECVILMLGQNELPKFMDMALDELKNGVPLADIIKMHNDQKVSEIGGNESSLTSDTFWVNPNTGAVEGFSPKTRNVMTKIAFDSDTSTAKKIADDLATFIRYSAFSIKQDDEAKVEALFEYIKGKQKTYSITRFDDIYYAGKEMDPYIVKLLAEKEEEEGDEDEPEPIDDFIRTLRIHQQQMRSVSPAEEKSDEDSVSSNPAINKAIGDKHSKALRDKILAVYYLP